MSNTVRELARDVYKNRICDHLPRKVDRLIQSWGSNIQTVPHPTLVITLDSCRYDTFVEAYDGDFPAEPVRAHSHAPWTLPSHEAIVRGGLPNSPDKGWANDYPESYVPLPRYHEESWGAVTMQYLHDDWWIDSPVPTYFDRWEGKDISEPERIIQTAKQFVEEASGSWFGLVNLGPTHFPYGDRCNMSQSELVESLEDEDQSLDYQTVHEWQIEACRDALNSLTPLIESLPTDTNVIVTADHGELFGEKGAFGHNYHQSAEHHEKLFEVPLLSWVIGDDWEHNQDASGGHQDIPESVRERLEETGYLSK